MKLLLLILIIGALAYSEGNESISIALVNDWITADQVLGIDCYQSGSSDFVLAACNQNSVIRVYEATTGLPTGVTIPLATANDYSWGVVWSNDPASEEYYSNDMAQNSIYRTDDNGVTWTTVPNPSNGSGRGMDFDGTNYWITNGVGGGLWCFQPGGTQENIEIPEIPTSPSGLTVFPFQGKLGIAVTAYSTHSIFFYLWDGASISFLGSADCPVSSVNASFGLAYAENGSIFWTYRVGPSEYHLAELSFSIFALEQSSWGSIKTSF